MVIAVTIDGASGTGKTLLAKNLAEKLEGCHYSTGLLYRKYGYISVLHDTQDVSFLQKSVKDCPEGDYLKKEEVADRASLLASREDVRAIVLEQQQQDIQQLLDAGTHTVLDGRDAGSVIWPQAQCKLFLKADPAVCWARREKELGEQSEHIRALMNKRDARDRERSVSPLIVPDGAKEIVADGSPSEVLEQAWSYVNKRLLLES